MKACSPTVDLVLVGIYGSDIGSHKDISSAGRLGLRGIYVLGGLQFPFDSIPKAPRKGI